MNLKNRISNSVQETKKQSCERFAKLNALRGLRCSSPACQTLFAVLFLFVTGIVVGCVGPDTAPRSNYCVQQAASCPSCSQNSDFRGQTPCQTCPTSTVSQYSGGAYRNSITVTCCNPMALWEAMVIPVRKYFSILREEPCRQINNVINPGNLVTNRTIGATVFEPWRGDSVGARQRWEATLHTIGRRAIIKVWPNDHNSYTIEVVVNKDIENASPVNMSRNGQDNYFLSDSRRTFTDPLFSAENQSSDQWVCIGRDPLLEQRLLAEIEQSIRARCR